MFMKHLDKILQAFMPLFKGYHIILVPKDKSRTRTFKVSGFSLKVLVVSVVLSVPLFLISVLSTIHYQNKLIALKRANYENQQLWENKKELVLKFAAMEKGLSQMDESLNHLGQVLDIDPQGLQMGLGPVYDIDEYVDDEHGSLMEQAAVDTDRLVKEWLEQNGEITSGRFYKKLMDLQSQTAYLNKRIESLFEQNKEKIRFVNATPSLLPVEGWVTSEYGMRIHPLSRRFRMHYGMDIASPYGTPIKTPADGVVIYTGNSGGYGNVVVIDHGYGISSLLGHASKIDAKLGQKVARGDVVAYVGSTGAASGNHLHYEIRVDGIPADPMSFVAQQ